MRSQTAAGTLEARIGEWLAELGSGAAAAALLSAAEVAVTESGEGEIPPELWHRYLNETRRPAFLQALPDAEARHRWAETSFAAIRRSEYGLLELFEQRVREYPQRVFLQEMEGRDARPWSYQRILRRVRAIAAVFWKWELEGPRVAILSENHLDGACADLACLTHDMLVTPLNPHFPPETLAWIFGELGINVVVAGTEELRDRVDATRPLLRDHPKVFLLDAEARPEVGGEMELGAALAELGPREEAEILARRPRRSVMDLATVMFTSGSTGRPKGVQFTAYNLLTKRFARAAALPQVGEGEILFSYLPLYHTFGRFLELMGMLFWGGTYVFAGNPSLETLLAGLRDVQPTGLISIPRRWQQIKETCLAEMDAVAGKARREEAFRGVVGGRLRWGLSAAGALESEAFRFFQRHGVDLCSGFGMTEATGGITMTPPGAYEDDSVGVPLPGLRTRLSEEGELLISGHYVATYLGEPVPSPDSGHWLATGDIFRRRESGHYEIVDRIKDIYKNSKGQTVAPGAIESRLSHVPGIHRCFVVGDGREYNVLLIVPDLEDPVLSHGPDAPETFEYFQQIVSTANQGLAPYERVVNFAVLDRDFEQERGELTPKGSYRRKVIEKHFQETIEALYRSDRVTVASRGFRVEIPRWFFRDLGILETEIVPHEGGLLNRRAGSFLRLSRRAELGLVAVGDLEYRFEGDTLDLGLFARQPRLWLGNPSLVRFGPCKEGWDFPLGGVSPQVFRPIDTGDGRPPPAGEPTGVREPALADAHRLCVQALFGEEEESLRALAAIEARLGEASHRLSRALFRRVEALARHPSLAVRARAYKLFLLSGPLPDYTRELPSFLLSGLPFLSEESIEAIANAKIERVRLDVLRLRLQHYRTHLSWPASDTLRAQLEGIFELLESFVRHHPSFYPQVRAELVSWALHYADPAVSRSAQGHLDRMVAWFENHLEETTSGNEPHHWEGKIVFQERMTPDEIAVLEKALVGTTFLKQSIMLAYEDRGVEVAEIADRGVWIAQVFSYPDNRVYRMSVNTKAGKHYDLLLGTATDREEVSVRETTYWMLALGGRAGTTPVVRQFGCYRPELGAFSMALVNDLTVWERVRELTGESFVEFHPSSRHWRNLFVRGMAAFFRGWRDSEGRIVPGPVSPTNVMVPAPDFRSGGTILSLADWRAYQGPLSLVRPMVKNFYFPTVSYYPQTREELDICWLFDAAMEALGAGEGKSFLEELRGELRQRPDRGAELGWELEEPLERYLGRLASEYRLPLPLVCAVERYQEWDRSNPYATPYARERQVMELHKLYGLAEHGELGRYTLYRKTYFAASGPDVTGAFDRLLRKMFRHPEVPPTHMIELSDLQATLDSEADRLVFSHMVFPAGRRARPVDVVAIGGEEAGQVVVQSHVRDRSGEEYTVREPIGPAEVGRLYRLYLDSGMPLDLSDQARYLLALDAEQRVVAGICFKVVDSEVAYMDGLVVSAPLRGKGLGGELLEDFSLRMQSRGLRAINTHFISRPFLKAHGFHVDKEWGGLVRFLEGSEAGGGGGRPPHDSSGAAPAHPGGP